MKNLFNRLLIKYCKYESNKFFNLLFKPFWVVWLPRCWWVNLPLNVRTIVLFLGGKYLREPNGGVRVIFDSSEAANHFIWLLDLPKNHQPTNSTLLARESFYCYSSKICLLSQLFVFDINNDFDLLSFERVLFDYKTISINSLSFVVLEQYKPWFRFGVGKSLYNCYFSNGTAFKKKCAQEEITFTEFYCEKNGSFLWRR